MNNDFLGNLGYKPKDKKTPQPQVAETPTPQVPYGALAIDNKGLPFYGDGFKGWVRKSWADLTDPSKYMQDQFQIPDTDFGSIKEQYSKDIESLAKGIEEKTNWSKWGADFFGLSSKELAALPAGFKAEQSIAGEISEESGSVLDSPTAAAVGRGIRLGVDTTQNLIWGGLEILGFDDTIMRKVHSTSVGLDAIADTYNKDTTDNWLEKFTSIGVYAVGKDLATVAGAIFKGKTTLGEVWNTTGKYRAGSDMAYTMIFDEIARAQFEKGIEEGKDPALLAQQLGHAGTELLGSIFGSPTTYAGLALKLPVNPLKNLAIQGADTVSLFSKTFNVPWKTVAKIPQFGEMIYKLTGGNIAIGATRQIVKSIDNYVDVAVPGLDEILKNADTVEGSLRAESTVALATLKIKETIDGMRKAPGFSLFSLDSSGKANVLSKQGGLVINSVISRYGMDVGLRMLNDMVALRKEGVESVQAAARLMGSDYNRLFFSTAGMTTGEILSRMADSQIAGLVQKHADDPKMMVIELTKRLENVTNAIIPSVDEMWNAKKAVTEAKRIGESIPEKTMELAKKFDEVPWVIKQVTKLTSIPVVGPKAVSGATSRTMAFMYMDLAPRYFVRNIYGQTLMTAIHIGLGTAMQTAISAFKPLVPIVGKTLTKAHVNTAEETLFKRLGMYSARAAAGIGKVTGNEGIGFIKAAQGAEQIFSSEIVLKASTDELMKNLSKAVDFPEWAELTAKLPKEQSGLLYNALTRTYGDFDEAVSLFRKWTGKGEIDAWKLIDPPPAMTKELERMGLLEHFRELQDSATSSDDFQKVIKGFVKEYKEAVTNEAAKMPWVASGKDSEDLALLAQDLVQNAGKRENEVITGLIQAHDNTYQQLIATKEAVIKKARDMFTDIAMQTQDKALLGRLEKIEQSINEKTAQKPAAKQAMNYLRGEIARFKNEITNAQNMNPAQKSSALIDLWNEEIKYKGQSLFKLSDAYPDIDKSKITDPNEFRKLMWGAFFEKQYSDIYGATNSAIYQGVFDDLNKIAELAGSKVEEMAGAINSQDNPFFILAKYRKEAENIDELYSYMRFHNQMNRFPDDAMLSQVIGKFNFKGWEGNKSHIVNAVKKPYEEITIREAHRAIAIRTAKPVVPPDAGTLPNAARVAWEGLDNFVADVEKYSDKVVSEWGVKVPTVATSIENELKAIKKIYNPRLNQLQSHALVIGEATRDFVLHDYNKTYADHALTYILGNSFHYWSTRTYQKALHELVGQPRFANAYMAYKDYNQKAHADRPEWMRTSVSLGGMPGVDGSNEYFINLESMINPIYGLTGADFNDPRKRVDTVSRMVDDMNKMGPSFSPLVSWAVAMHLYNKGEEEASQRWVGRLFPQSSLVKSASATPVGQDILGKFGITGAVELDPFVSFLDGGVDPYERNRVAASMSMMVQNQVINPATGQPVTKEEMIDASRLKEGDLWDAAVEYTSDQRFLSDAASYFLGSAVRPRTQNDVVMDKFWGEYNVLVGSRNVMTSDNYRQAWDTMRDKYPFMDAILISRKSGVEQDTALAYNTIARIPPGQASDVAEIVGIKPYMLQEFYDSKGDFNKMGLNEQDKTRFMQGIIDMSLMFAIPNGATKQEWNMARSQYSDMSNVLKKQFGEDISDRMNQFYDVEESQREDFLELNPDVKAAMDARTAYIAQTPILAAYYGGLNTVERYHYNKVYNTLDEEFGKMDEKIREYEELLLTDPKAAKRFKKAELQAYYDRRSELYAEADANIIKTAPTIPNTMPYTIRPEFMPNSGIQEDLYGYDNQPSVPSWDQFQQLLSPALEEIVVQHFEEGTEIKYSAGQQLDKIANTQGMTQYELLRQMGMSLQQGQSPQATEQPSFLNSLGYNQ